MKRVSLELLTQKNSRIELSARVELSETLSDPATHPPIRPIANSIHIHSGHQMTANDSEQ